MDVLDKALEHISQLYKEVDYKQPFFTKEETAMIIQYLEKD
ncbi:hypothetical protein [Lactobacillus mulieris]|jgi:hypothetical protein|uniref:Uncharacterized protein n=1 Tax=Siphoviridae sp. ctX581 TaxID=2826365 RepID=A0A8S5MDS2_9CAUD|nr:hypothetical protein [Lactobacillus mulieris]MCW8093498.1 hypothetical protein [Lactobacillus mulieris]DAD80390.1 MAG TPA: hypothetical protein [Siphoviridae sp. ctX581]